MDSFPNSGCGLGALDPEYREHVSLKESQPVVLPPVAPVAFSPSPPPPPSSFPSTPTLKREKNRWQLAALPIWGLLVRRLLVPLSSPGLSCLGQGSGMRRAGASCIPSLASGFEVTVSELACFLVWLL